MKCNTSQAVRQPRLLAGECTCQGVCRGTRCQPKPLVWSDPQLEPNHASSPQPGNTKETESTNTTSRLSNKLYATTVLTSTAFVLFWADLNGTHHIRHVVNALAFTPGLATNQCLVHLYGPLRSDAVLVRANHAHTQFVQHLERCLVATEPKLALQLQRRHTRRLCRHEVAAQNHTCSGVRIACITVPAVNDVLRWQWRQRKTVGLFSKRYASPVASHPGHTKPSGQRTRSK